jgi:ubiquinone/menaquinone biosynthesis C-methylase UbiE
MWCPPVNFANIHEGEVIVDIDSGGGIDVFLSANKVKDSGKVIGIDMTDEMLKHEITQQGEDIQTLNSKKEI